MKNILIVAVVLFALGLFAYKRITVIIDESNQEIKIRGIRPVLADGVIKSYTKPPKEVIKEKLTKTQYEVTQLSGTEMAFYNIYWNHYEEGIYVDIVTGEPLFSSLDKYDSNKGWPAFSKPLVKENVIESSQKFALKMEKVIRSRYGNTYLGRIHDDLTRDTGVQYLVNSDALLFIPKANLEKQGYPQFMKLFEKQASIIR